MSTFRFKQFQIIQEDNAMKVGTDSMLLGSLVSVESKSNFLDIGAGTGVISLMLLQRNPRMKGVSIEIDELSSAECSKNVALSPWSSNLSVENIDFTEFESELKFDLIVSNPPYFQSRNLNDDERKARARHESSLPVNVLLSNAKRHMSENCDLWLVIPFEDFENWIQNAQDVNLFLKKRIDIYGKEYAVRPKRVIVNLNKTKSELIHSRFSIRNNESEYSDEYIELTKDYHLMKLR